MALEGSSGESGKARHAAGPPPAVYPSAAVLGSLAGVALPPEPAQSMYAAEALSTRPRWHPEMRYTHQSAFHCPVPFRRTMRNVI